MRSPRRRRSKAYIDPRRVFVDKIDIEDFPSHISLIRKMYPLIESQPAQIVIIARFMCGYDCRTICRRCGISATTLKKFIDSFSSYDNYIHPVPLKSTF